MVCQECHFCDQNGFKKEKKASFRVLDLVKAFDFLPREMLWKILTKLGVSVLMITWKASCKILVCMFRSKVDATVTGRSYRAYGKLFPVFEYADDTATTVDSRPNVSDRVSSINIHFARFASEIYTKLILPRRES